MERWQRRAILPLKRGGRCCQMKKIENAWFLLLWELGSNALQKLWRVSGNRARRRTTPQMEFLWTSLFGFNNVDYSSRSSALMKHAFLLYCHHFLNESNQREHSCIPGRNASLVKLKSLSVPLCQSMCDWCQDPLTTSLLVQTGASVVPICRPSLHGKFKLLHHCFQSCTPLTLDIVLCIIPMSLIK